MHAYLNNKVYIIKPIDSENKNPSSRMLRFEFPARSYGELITVQFQETVQKAYDFIVHEGLL